jgi:hypothetical protein
VDQRYIRPNDAAGAMNEVRQMLIFGMPIAERDYPELAQPLRACQTQMYSLDGGASYQVVPQYRAYCAEIMRLISPIAYEDLKLLWAATGSPVK